MNLDHNQHQSKPAGNKKKRVNGIAVFFVFIIAIIIITYQPAVTKIYCTEEIISSGTDVIMLAAWWCPYCYQARKYLQKNNVSYCEYDIENSETGKNLYEKVNGQGVPVLLIGDYQLNGFDEKSIEIALSQSHKK